MRKLVVFENVSLDGFYVDGNGDMSWAHGLAWDQEFNDFVDQNSLRGGELVFGRMTYQMMAGYWPSPMALEQNPIVAQGMNSRHKFVFSKTLSEATWTNTTLLTGDPAAWITELKAQEGPDLVILGSGSLVAQLTRAKLVDEFQILIVPVIVGSGRTLFDQNPRLKLKLLETRAFKNGKVFLRYKLQS